MFYERGKYNRVLHWGNTFVVGDYRLPEVNCLVSMIKSLTLHIDLIINNPFDNFLYEQLKDLPFSQVRKIYIDKDSLIDDKKDDTDDENKKESKRNNLIKHLFKIQTLIYLYDENQISQFIRKTEFKIDSVTKKREIKAIMIA